MGESGGSGWTGPVGGKAAAGKSRAPWPVLPLVLDDSLRPVKDRALGPLVDRLVGLPAAVITAVGLGLGLGSAGLAGAGLWVPALAAWGLNRLADGLDGEVARRSGTASDRGGYLDLVADVTVYGAIPLGVAAGVDHSQDLAWPVAAALLAAFYLNITTVTVLSALLEKRSAGAAARGQPTSVTLPRGLVEGTETIVFFTLVLAVPSQAVAIMGVMALAVAATAIGRIAIGWAKLGLTPSITPDRTER